MPCTLLPVLHTSNKDVPAQREYRGGREVWFTSFDYISNRVDSFDPVKEQFQEYESPTAKSVPHNPWVARNGQVWFSELIARKLSVIDPETVRSLSIRYPIRLAYTPCARTHRAISGLRAMLRDSIRIPKNSQYLDA